MPDPVQFFFALLALLIAPGPTNTMMAVAGAGPVRSLLPLFAAALAGYAAIIGLAAAVLLPLIALHPALGTVLRLAVIAYLIYAAVRLWRHRLEVGAGGPVRAGTIFVVTFLNPKGLILAVSVFPGPPLLGLFHVGVFTVLVLACTSCWYLLGKGLGRLASGGTRVVPRAGAVALIGFAALVAEATIW